MLKSRHGPVPRDDERLRVTVDGLVIDYRSYF
jgi:hypothetical protein